MKKIGLILINFLMIFGLSSAAVQPGLRGVFIYTYDSSFAGSDLQVQEVSSKIYEKVLASKEFLEKPKPLSSAYDFLNLLDGRCDIQLKCEKQECAKVVTPTCPPKQVCPTCKACPICPEVQQCRLIPEPTTTARTTTTTVRTTPRTTTTTERVTRPPSTYLPPSCDNGARNYPDCCLNGGSGPFCCANKANNKDCCLNGGKGKFCCTNGATNEFCCTNSASNKDCALRTITTPRPAVTTSKPFRGPTYLPIATISTSREPWTGTYGTQTYATRTYDGTFPQSRTWQPFTAVPSTYSQRSTTRNTRTFTTTPRYARLNIENGLYNNL